MTIRKTVLTTAFAFTLGAATVTPALASSADTLPEERSGALIGGIIGAGVGGPIGAGVGAMFGGGILGKAFGLNRQNGELRTDLAEARTEGKREQYRLEREIARLSSKLNEAKVEAATSPRLPIQFRTASSNLETHYEKELAGVAKAIAERPDAVVRLAGFADRRGDEDYNLALSKERVEAVKQFLVKHGVAGNRIMTEAYGETRPVASEPTPENHFFDRRVVLQVSVEDLPLASR